LRREPLGRAGDRGNEPAVVRLAAVGRAPVAEEALLVRIGAERKIGELADAGCGQPRADEGR
jgi:hypothetical protein